MKSITLPIDQIITETPRVKSFYFSYHLLAQPGQYLNVTIPGFGDRPFGAVVISKNRFLISVAAVGQATTAMHTLKEGDHIEMSGPFGTYFTLPPSGEPVALVAGGYGIAPLAFLAHLAAHNHHRVQLFAGAQTKANHIVYPFLEHPNIEIIRTTDDGSWGKTGYVTDAFTASIQEKVPGCVYIVGPPAMAEKIIAPCLEQSIPFQISMAEYASEPFGPVINDKKYRQLKQTSA